MGIKQAGCYIKLNGKYLTKAKKWTDKKKDAEVFCDKSWAQRWIQHLRLDGAGYPRLDPSLNKGDFHGLLDSEATKWAFRVLLFV